MALTLIGGTASVGDNGTQAGPTSAALPYANAGTIANGDLVIVAIEFKGSGVTLNFNETNGQTWSFFTQFADSGAAICARFAWCKYSSTADNGNNIRTSNGSGTTAHSSALWIFRPTVSTNLFAVDTDQVSSQFAAGSTPFTKTITGVTPKNNSNLSIAGWFSTDDNSWGNLAGTNWNNLNMGGDAQIRNLQGTDMSMAFAYQIQSIAAATNNVSKDQTALGGDAGCASIFTIYEYSYPIKNVFTNQSVNRASNY